MKKIILVLLCLFLSGTINCSAQDIDGDNGITLSAGESVTTTINVEETGNYTLEFEYEILTNTSDDILYSLEIDGVKIDTYFSLSKQYEVVDSEPKYDRYGDQIPNETSLYKGEIKDTVHVDEQLNTNGLNMNFDAGTHEIKFTLESGDIKLYSISPVLLNIPTYSEYLNSNTMTSIQEPIIIETENYYQKNNASISAEYSGDKESSPYSYKNQFVNTISLSKASSSISWSFSVEEAGYYPISIKYLMKDDSMPAHITVYVNGAIPYQEVTNYLLPFSDSYVTHTLSNGETPYLFYFEEGVNIITIQLNFATYEKVIDTLETINQDVNNIYLEVQKVTGNNTDKNIDWDLESFIPGITEDIKKIYTDLEAVLNELLELNSGETNIVTHYVELAMDTIEPFIYDINSLPSQIDLLYASTTSVGTYISNAINELEKTPLMLDQIYIGGTVETLPEYNMNFFEKFFVGIKQLVYSFVNVEETEEEYVAEIDVWVYRSKPYVDTLQSMIDEQFTPETGIKVNLSTMTTDQQLLLATSAGNQPDAVIGLPHNLVYEYAVRGAAYDLSSFEDFDEVATQFYPAALVPYAVNGQIYGLPETQDFNVLFYRTDIVEEYNLEIPETWEDVENLMPTLDRYSMTFYTYLSSGAATKTINQTSPYFMQNNCEFYDEETYMTTITSEACIESMTTMTELFTIYGVPLQVPNFFEYFRTGKAPMGVGNFSTYLQLMTSAPELKGKWSIAPMPGTENEDGTINHAAPAADRGVMILQDTQYPNETWTFIKWWLSTEIQTDYAYQLYYTYGPSYLWNTANVEAFINGPFPNQHKEVILEQWSYMQEPPKIPGSYMLEREISNAWNSIVLEEGVVLDELEKAKINIDREITTKMQEFGYMDENGEIIKEYEIPDTESIEVILNE